MRSSRIKSTDEGRGSDREVRRREGEGEWREGRERDKILSVVPTEGLQNHVEISHVHKEENISIPGN